MFYMLLIVINNKEIIGYHGLTVANALCINGAIF